MTFEELDDLVTRLYRAATSMQDAGWQGLLKNAAFSLSAAAQRPATLVAAVALIDTVLVLAEHARQLDPGLTQSLRQGVRTALGPTRPRSSLARPGDASFGANTP